MDAILFNETGKEVSNQIKQVNHLVELKKLRNSKAKVYLLVYAGLLTTILTNS
jgi:hypothetical protein